MSTRYFTHREGFGAPGSDDHCVLLEVDDEGGKGKVRFIYRDRIEAVDDRPTWTLDQCLEQVKSAWVELTQMQAGFLLGVARQSKSKWKVRIDGGRIYVTDGDDREWTMAMATVESRPPGTLTDVPETVAAVW